MFRIINSVHSARLRVPRCNWGGPVALLRCHLSARITRGSIHASSFHQYKRTGWTLLARACADTQLPRRPHTSAPSQLRTQLSKPASGVSSTAYFSNQACNQVAVT
jgi:hypothetical protein